MFLKKIYEVYKKIHTIDTRVNWLQKEIDCTKILIGNLLSSKFNGSISPLQLHECEFKVFSQYGDDGIIQYLINLLKVETKIFIEFGVQNYYESNTRFLLVNNYWKGLVIEGNKSDVAYIKKDEILWKYDLTVCNDFINKDNINQLFEKNHFTGKIGVLSIDIDGNDYWIWDAIMNIDPVIVIVEYNSLFGDKFAVTIPYNANFVRSNANFSNIYYGASLKAFKLLADKKGYAFVGTNSAGNNAYFVKKDNMCPLNEIKIDTNFKDRIFKESKDVEGRLNFLAKVDALKTIKDEKLFDLESNVIITIGQLIERTISLKK